MVSKTIGVAIELTSLIPLWRPAIERPHDGIVEHDSCALAPSGPGRRSEKDGSINHPDHFGRTYVHIFHEACDDLMHVTLQGDSSVIGLVKSLLLADSLVDWEQSLDTDTVRRIKVTPDD